jgi:hypothetical protein
MKARSSLAFACDGTNPSEEWRTDTCPLPLALTLRQPSVLETDRLSPQLCAIQLLGHLITGLLG